jgi:hypothetical protein
MPKKKNRCESDRATVIISDIVCEAYRELCGGRFHTYGLDIFLRRGMLEWMRTYTVPAVTRTHKPMEPHKIKVDECIALLTNMMEAGQYGI